MKKTILGFTLISLFIIVVISGCIEKNDNSIRTKPIILHDISQDGVYRPAIFGKYISWVQDDNIILYDLSTNHTNNLTNNETKQDNPDIYNNYIVWENIREYNSQIHTPKTSDIILYNVDTNKEKIISTNNCTNRDPIINEHYVIWVEIFYNYTFPMSINMIRIALYDINTSILDYIAHNYTNHYQHDLKPDIYGNYIVWTDQRNGQGYNSENPNYDIYLYNISDKSEMKISLKNAYEGAPKIYKNNIYWQEYLYDGGLKGEFYHYNISNKNTEFLFEYDGNMVHYEVTDDYIVWCDGDIRLFDIYSKKIFIISSDPNDGNSHSQGIHDLYEDKIVWEYSVHEIDSDYPDIIKESNVQYGIIEF